MADGLPACYTIDVSQQNDFWKSDSVLMNVIPILGGQVALVIFLTHLLYYILEPLHQPRLVSDILAGFLMSPTILGPKLFQKIFPARGILSGETIANMGMAFYIFLTALEMNPNIILRAQKKAKSIAIAGIIIPMMIGAGIFGLHQIASRQDSSDGSDNTPKAYLLWSLALSVTGFPVLVHILVDLKLLYTELGRVALNAALISDIYNWLMFVLLIPFVVNGNDGIYSVLSTAVFVVICFYVVRPALVELIERRTEQEAWQPQHLLFVVLGALLCAHITDTLGTHSIVGAFVYGLILPHGRFADMVIENTDYFVSSIIAPLFFVSCGIRINFGVLAYQEPWYVSMAIILLLCALKIFSTFIATSFFGMPARDGMSFGLLMNTKGVLSIVMLNIAWDRKILNSSSYTLMMSTILLMTMVVSPIINVMYKPRKMFAQYKLRTIQKLRIDVELRVVACVHNTRHAMSIISIFEALNPTRISPLQVFALHLIEVTGRATALVATHMEDSSSYSQTQNITKSQEDFETIANSFEAFEHGHEAIKVETLSVFSTYATIHEDVHNIAKDKRAPLILLPFHRYLNEEGALETTNVAIRDINMNVLHCSPCSVGIVVDRGLGSLSSSKMHILMVFIGGPDDQEALAIAWRMAGQKGIKLSVVRIVLYDDAAKRDTSSHSETGSLLSATMDSEKQSELDDEYVSSFRLKAVDNEDSITYFEKAAHNGEDISAILTDLDKNGYDLYIVGQGRGRNLFVLSQLLEWSDYPELGAIGDILASNTFGSGSSVLVVQQYGSVGVGSGRTMQPFKQENKNSDDFEAPFVRTV